MNPPDMQASIAQLIKAADITHSPTASDAIRLDATHFLETFKTTNPPLYLLQVSLEIIRNPNHSIQTRHYGFQAFEHVLQHSYTQIAPQDKLSIKAKIMELIQPIQAPDGSAILSPMVNYQVQSKSILSSKLVSLLVKIIQHDWPTQWGDLYPKLFSFYQTVPSIDYCLFLSELLSSVLDLTGSPNTSIPDKRRKDIFSQTMKVLGEFLPSYFSHFDTLIKIISCHVPTVQSQLPYLYESLPNIGTAVNEFIAGRSTIINDQQLRWYVKHALELSMRLSQHVCERINLNDTQCTTLFSLLSSLLCLPEACDEASEHVLMLLKRRTGVPLQYQTTTLLQVWETLIELGSRMLSRQTICNQAYTLFPRKQQTQAQFFNQQLLLVKVLRCINQLITGFSGGISGILSRSHTAIRNMTENGAVPNPTQQQEVVRLEQMILSVNRLRTTLMQLLCRAASDLDCNDLVCCEALMCLLECTNNRLYQTYITNSWFKSQNLIEPVLQELWNVVLINNDREKHAILEKKSRGGSVLAHDDDGLGPNMGAVQDITGQIRSSLQTLAKHLADHQPHLVIKLVGFTYHNCIQQLLEIVTIEQNAIKATNTFHSTIANNAKDIDYVFQTSSEFQQMLFPTYHYGGHQFFTSKAFLFLSTLTTLGKAVFTRIQSLMITIQQNPIDPQAVPIELTPHTEFKNHSEIPPHWLDGLYPLFIQLHDLLTTCPQACLGYMTYTVSLLVKLTPLYAHSPEHLNKTLMMLLSIGSINPNNMLSQEDTNFIGSSHHDGMHYNALFIDQTTQQSISNQFNTKCDPLSSIAGSGREGINMGPLLDLRKHAFHAILNLTKYLPQAFEANYLQFCNHILMLINPDGPKPDQGPNAMKFITIQTEAVVFIEILLCLALYFNNQTLIQSIYSTLIAPHCQFILSSLDLAYFTADVNRFSTILYGSHDEYKLIQFQLLQWGAINADPPKASISQSSNIATVSTDTLMDTRSAALPKPSTASLIIPSAASADTLQKAQAIQQQFGTFDNRYQSLRKQLLFALHTIQCICKLLYTQTIAGDTSTILSIVSPHRYNQAVGGQGEGTTSIGLAVESLATQQQQAIKLAQQATIAREMLSSITQQLYPAVLRLTALFLVCTTDVHLSTLSNRLQAISSTNGFDSFLSLFSSDGYITTPQTQHIYGNQALLDQMWAQSCNPQVDPSTKIFSGFLDVSSLPSNLAQLPLPAQLPVTTCKVIPADKSQNLLRHLWAWNDSFFETLTQLFTVINHVNPDVIALDLLSIPKMVQSVNDAMFIKQSPLASMDMLLKQTTSKTTPTPGGTDNNLVALPISLPAAWIAYSPYVWTVILGVIPSLPTRRQRLMLQRFIQPFLRTLPLQPLQSTPQSPLITQHSLVAQQPSVLSIRLLPQIVPSILLTITSIITSNIRDAILFHKYGLSSPSSAITTMSPTLSTIADGVGVNAVSNIRRLRGSTANHEHLKYLNILVAIQTHSQTSPNDPAASTLGIYRAMQSYQHLLSTSPLTSSYIQQSLSQPQQFINNSHCSVMLEEHNNALTQNQTQLLNTTIQELQSQISGSLSNSQYKILYFPGEIDSIKHDLQSALQRYDLSRLIASVQHQQTPDPTQKIAKRIFSGELLHIFADQLDHAEMQHYFSNASSVLQMFCSTPVNNERSLSNALGMLKQSQMFLALPICSRLAELSSVTPNICYMISALWESIVRVNLTSATYQSAFIATRQIISFLRYVGIVLCYASICTAQRAVTPAYLLDAFNMGLYFRQLYYSANKKKEQPPSTPFIPGSTSTEDKYAGLIVKKHAEDIIQTLNENPQSTAALIFTHDDYWLHLHNLQAQNPQSEEGLTATFLRAAPGLLQWLQTLFNSTVKIIQRHLFVMNVLDLSQRQQQQEQSLGSPILDVELLDMMFILTRDILALLLQCSSFVNQNDLLSMLQSAVIVISGTKPQASSPVQPITDEIAATLLEYARCVDIDSETHAGTVDGQYFSYADFLNNKKGVMSEKNNQLPHSCIPSQTRAAKDQYKSLLTDILIKSFQ